MLNETLQLNQKTILVTGAAGFIGSNLVLLLLQRYPDCCIIGIDNLNGILRIFISKKIKVAQ